MYISRIFYAAHSSTSNALKSAIHWFSLQNNTNFALINILYFLLMFVEHEITTLIFWDSIKLHISLNEILNEKMDVARLLES